MSDDEARRRWFRDQVLPLEADLRETARGFCRQGQSDPDDLVQETFSRLIVYQGWRDVAQVRAFAVRVLKNLALDAERRRKIVSITAMADLERLNLADAAPSPETWMEARDELRLLQQIVEAMPTQCRRVFTLRKIYGKSPGEIAVALGLSVSTVEKHLVKALRICSEQFAKRGSVRFGVKIREVVWPSKPDQNAKT